MLQTHKLPPFNTEVELISFSASIRYDTIQFDSIWKYETSVQRQELDIYIVRFGVYVCSQISFQLVEHTTKLHN